MGKYILTGGPGVGKTTLVEMIRKEMPERFYCMDEPARYIIEVEQKKEASLIDYKGILPWTDIERFQYIVADFYNINMRSTPRNIDDLVIDRSIVDSIAYLLFNGANVPDRLYWQAKNMEADCVFIPDRLPFYNNDEQRKESDCDAKNIHELLYDCYHEMGHKIVRIPAFGKQERLEYIMRHTRSSG